MMKKMKLADVPFGKNFEIWGHTYTVLDGDDKGVFVLEADAVCEMPFREDEADYKVAPNDFRDSSVRRAYLEGRYIDGLVSVGAKLDEDILRMEIDLKCTLGQYEYGTERAYAGLLTLEQYGKYYDIIPRIDTTYWLATPWKTPSRSPNADDTHYVWSVRSSGDCNDWNYYYTYGVRPALTLSPSLLVSVECDEEEEVESKWHEYLEYLIHWAISHSDKGFAGCCLVCYDEWLDNEGSDDGSIAEKVKRQRKGGRSVKCRDCKNIDFGLEQQEPGERVNLFFGWCRKINDSPDLDMERECEFFMNRTCSTCKHRKDIFVPCDWLDD